MSRITTSPEAFCVTCRWECRHDEATPQPDIWAAAQQHAKAAGHCVLVDILNRTTYVPDARQDAAARAGG